MLYNVTDLMREVRIALDHNNSSAELTLLRDIDTLTLDQIIESKIEQAAYTVESTAPNVLLDNGKDFSGRTINWISSPGHGSGEIALPHDFLRLMTFKMSDWDYGVTAMVREGEPLYSRQYTRFPGIRGNPQRPVVTVSNRPNDAMAPSGLVLEFFSCTLGPAVRIERAVYIPLPTIDSNGQIDISERLHTAIVYYTAHLTAQAIGEQALASMMLETSKQMMQMA